MIFGDGSWRQAEAWNLLLAGRLRWGECSCPGSAAENSRSGYVSNTQHSVWEAVLRSEIPSAKLRTVAASNNRDHARNLSYYCMLALHVLWCYSSRTYRSWWVTQSTQHHRRGCIRGHSTTEHHHPQMRVVTKYVLLLFSECDGRRIGQNKDSIGGSSAGKRAYLKLSWKRVAPKYCLCVRTCLHVVPQLKNSQRSFFSYTGATSPKRGQDGNWIDVFKIDKSKSCLFWLMCFLCLIDKNVCWFLN